MDKQVDFRFSHNTEPSKRFKYENYCLSCGDPLPPDKEFCDNDICEDEFYRESELEVDEEEVLAEQEMLRREEMKLKAGLFED